MGRLAGGGGGTSRGARWIVFGRRNTCKTNFCSNMWLRHRIYVEEYSFPYDMPWRRDDLETREHIVVLTSCTLEIVETLRVVYRDLAEGLFGHALPLAWRVRTGEIFYLDTSNFVHGGD